MTVTVFSVIIDFASRDMFLAGVAQLEEQLTCNQQVAGSSPIAGSKMTGLLFLYMEGFPSGQREQTVNLPVTPSQVRILPPPPKKPESRKQQRF